MDSFVLKLAAVIGVLVAFGGVLAYAAGLRLAIGPTRADVDAIGFDSCGLGSLGVKGYGRYPDLRTDSRLRGEVFDRTVIWTSWFKDGDSYPIVGEAKVTRCGLEPTTWPTKVRYEFSVNNGGSAWEAFYNDRVPNGVVELPLSAPGPGTAEINAGAFSWTIDGFSYCTVPTTTGCPLGKDKAIADGAVLRVNVVGVCTGLFGCPPGAPNPSRYALAQDEVDLRSAIPKVTWSANSYKVGQVATVRWDVPVVADERGNPAYFLSVFDENTHAPVSGFDRIALSSTSGSTGFPVTQSMFSNVLATCQNRIRAQLFSQLIVADQQDASVQAVASIAGTPPAVASVSLDKNEYFEGDTVKVTWTTSSNVSKIHVTAHVSGLAVFDQDVPGSQSSVSFTVPRSGILQVEVTAYNLCQPSDVDREYATVGNAYPGLCEAYPDLAQCSSSNVWGLVKAAVAVLAVLIVAGLVLWILSKFEAVPGFLLLLLPIVAAGLAAILLLQAGWFDALLMGWPT